MSSSERLVRQLRRAIRDAIADRRGAADALLPDGVETIGIRRYGIIPVLEKRAVNLDYARLA